MSRRRKAVLLVLISLVGLLPLSYVIATPAHALTRFSSYWELKHFLATNGCGSYYQSNYGVFASSAGLSPAPLPASSTGQLGLYGASDTSDSPVPQHSGTNNQVAGVDEPDTVKNDGQYIYLVTNNTVLIIEAYPATTAKVVSRVSVNGTVEGIFVDANSLAVLLESAQYDTVYTATGQVASSSLGMGQRSIYPYWYPSQTTSILLFDSSDRSHPILKTSLSVNGTYVDARLIDHTVYMIATDRASCSAVLPELNVNGQVTLTTPEQVYHSDIRDYGQAFTSIVSLDIVRPNAGPSVATFLIGTSSIIYASLKDIYLTSPNWSYGQETVIHRLILKNGSVSYQATGSVPGTLLNQFSMDEYNGFFRVTTTTQSSARNWFGQDTNLYVLDSRLRTVGALEGLSPGERFHSARFMENRAYLVTFKKTDPLFVINLQDPTKPTVLGELNVTGYSDYLQPYDQNHLIGIGKDTVDAGSFAWYQGVKVSLFDVSDTAHPREIGRYVIGARGSDSLALRDHKAVLFDRSLDLLVIPVQVVPAVGQTGDVWQYGSPTWQGAYVFNITIDNGLVFRGGITHVKESTVTNQNGYWMSQNSFVTRSLYIGDVLYTISGMMVKMNSLQSLQEINSVDL